MYRKLKILLFIVIAYNANALYAISNDTTIGKNIIGVDINYAEFFGASGYYQGERIVEAIYVPYVNFNLKYNRHLHRYLDVSTSFGFTTFYVGFLGYLKFNALPLFTPLKKQYKTLQIGSGFTLLNFYKDKAVLCGLTNQFNYIKKSKKKKFTWGFNLYGNIYFGKKRYGGNYFTIGTGFLLGGYFN